MTNRNSERYLTFALGKGRLANQTLKLFEQIGITCEEMKDKETRKLIFVNGHTTGVNHVTIDKMNANAPMYNLAGQRVSKNYKGVVIQNGKKFFNK